MDVPVDVDVDELPDPGQVLDDLEQEFKDAWEKRKEEAKQDLMQRYGLGEEG